MPGTRAGTSEAGNWRQDTGATDDDTEEKDTYQPRFDVIIWFWAKRCCNMFPFGGKTILRLVSDNALDWQIKSHGCGWVVMMICKQLGVSGQTAKRYLGLRVRAVSHGQNSSVQSGALNFYSEAGARDDFHDYVRFQPDGGIPVTIGRVDWGWNGASVVIGKVWQWSAQLPPNWYGGNLDRNDDSFPVWPKTYTGN